MNGELKLSGNDNMSIATHDLAPDVTSGTLYFSYNFRFDVRGAINNNDAFRTLRRRPDAATAA